MTFFRFATTIMSLFAMTNGLRSKLVMKHQRFLETSTNANTLFKPNTENQQVYRDLLYANNKETAVVVCEGPAGTGKTSIAVMYAIAQLQNADVNKIVITRPTVPVENEALGFLPGNLDKKMEPWTRPIMDIFQEYYTPRELQKILADTKKVELAPLAYMRGRTFKNTIIIADEMQNSSPAQMRMLLSRMGEQCKTVVTGDLSQGDVAFENNGLGDLLARLEKVKPSLLKNIRMTDTDIVRSAVVTEVLRLYEEATTTNTSFPAAATERRKLDNDAAMIPLAEFDRIFRAHTP